MIIRKKLHIAIILSLMLLVTVGMIHPVAAYADSPSDSMPETTDLEFGTGSKCTITNAEGEKLVYNKGDFSGNMLIHRMRPPDPRMRPPFPGSNSYTVEVNYSASFTYTPKGNKDISFDVQNSKYSGTVEAKNAESVTISINAEGEKSITIDGKDVEYVIDFYAPNNSETGITLEGSNASHITMTDGKEGIIIDGAEGVCHLTVDNLEGIEQKIDIFPYTNPVIIGNITEKRTPLTVSGAIVLGKKSYDVVGNLRLWNTDDVTSLLVSFSKVKKADGYDVYRYNEKLKKYVKVKTLKGNWNIAWLSKGLVSGQQYRYKVQPWQTVSKKKKAMKMSYNVWAITASETTANATKIVLDQAKIAGKKGQTTKLTAALMTVEGKEVLSGNIRWHSSDKTIATVDKKGKVKLLKKGTCKVWAKTHNGINSKKVTIRVK